MTSESGGDPTGTGRSAARSGQASRSRGPATPGGRPADPARSQLSREARAAKALADEAARVGTATRVPPGADGEPPAGPSAQADGGQRGSGQQRRPSLGGGIPAQGRELGVQGRLTIRKLLEAGLVEFDKKGFQTVRVEDVVRRAKTSHGTFYLYFANKDDLFRTLLRDALHDMEIITDDFPVVTRNEVGQAALRRWIHAFSDTYAAHATVIRILSQADIVGEEVFGDGLRLLFRLSEAMTQGMTAAAAPPGGTGGGDGEGAELTALACLMMLERINYLMTAAEVRLPREEMVDRLASIMYAAFHAG